MDYCLDSNWVTPLSIGAGVISAYVLLHKYSHPKKFYKGIPYEWLIAAVLITSLLTSFFLGQIAWDFGVRSLVGSLATNAIVTPVYNGLLIVQRRKGRGKKSQRDQLLLMLTGRSTIKEVN